MGAPQAPQAAWGPAPTGGEHIAGSLPPPRSSICPSPHASRLPPVPSSWGGGQPKACRVPSSSSTPHPPPKKIINHAPNLTRGSGCLRKRRREGSGAREDPGARRREEQRRLVSSRRRGGCGAAITPRGKEGRVPGSGPAGGHSPWRRRRRRRRGAVQGIVRLGSALPALPPRPRYKAPPPPRPRRARPPRRPRGRGGPRLLAAGGIGMARWGSPGPRRAAGGQRGSGDGGEQRLTVMEWLGWKGTLKII